MGLLQLSAILIALAALFAFVNQRLFGLPTTIGVMLISLVASLVLVTADALGLGIADRAAGVVQGIDFNRTLMDGMLSFLLFAGALHVNLSKLWDHRYSIGLLASVGVLVSTFIVGGASYVLFHALGLDMPFLYCLVFGALISPTDPIAVLAILKQAGVSEELETSISGESLFNDGIGIVIFLTILGLITAGHGQPSSVGDVALLFAQEALGGAALGLALGGLVFWLINQVDDYHVEVLLTLALVPGGYELANVLHASGPLAMVVAGLLIGNQGRRLAMSDTTRQHLDTFWELVDEILNTILFMLIGLEIIVIAIDGRYLIAGLAAIPIVLAARFLVVGLPVRLMRPFHGLGRNAGLVMTWAGLRGGISVALALSLPPSDQRDIIIAVTYCVVLFSIIVQGLSVGRVLARLTREPDA